jgi:hypothetical protein
VFLLFIYRYPPYCFNYLVTGTRYTVPTLTLSRGDINRVLVVYGTDMS